MWSVFLEGPPKQKQKNILCVPCKTRKKKEEKTKEKEKEKKRRRTSAATPKKWRATHRTIVGGPPGAPAMQLSAARPFCNSASCEELRRPQGGVAGKGGGGLGGWVVGWLGGWVVVRLGGWVGWLGGWVVG